MPLVNPCVGTNHPEDPLESQPDYGNDAGIQFRHRNAIKISHRVKFANIWFDHCNPAKQRKFLLLTENAVVANYPSACFCIPPNCCCPGNDHISWNFFDRGIFDRQGCLWSSGCLSGEPELYPGEIKYVCCFQDCPKCWNEWQSCWWPCCLGERVRYLPAQTCCWCVPVRVNGCMNCCGCNGVKSGEPCPCFLVPMATHLLDIGEAERFASDFHKVRAEWAEFTGKK